MATAVWTVFAVAVMVGIFIGCVLVVAGGLRVAEKALAKHREKGS